MLRKAEFGKSIGKNLESCQNERSLSVAPRSSFLERSACWAASAFSIWGSVTGKDTPSPPFAYRIQHRPISIGNHLNPLQMSSAVPVSLRITIQSLHWNAPAIALSVHLDSEHPGQGPVFFICAFASILDFTFCSVLATMGGCRLLGTCVWQCQLPAAFIIKGEAEDVWLFKITSILCARDVEGRMRTLNQGTPSSLEERGSLPRK